MQDLLTAKTTIAAQTDRLLSHYRSQIAQYEAEVSCIVYVIKIRTFFLCIYLLLSYDRHISALIHFLRADIT